jgi:hypothetical protein
MMKMKKMMMIARMDRCRGEGREVGEGREESRKGKRMKPEKERREESRGWQEV